MNKPIPSPNKRTEVFSGKKFNNGRTLASKSRVWMELNEDAFFAIYGYVKGLQAEERRGRLRDRVAVWCVEHQIELGCDGYTFSNTYWAAIARYLVLYDESLRGNPIEFHKSDIDFHGLWPVSYLPELGDSNEAV